MGGFSSVNGREMKENQSYLFISKRSSLGVNGIPAKALAML